MHSKIRLADLFPGAIPEPAVAADESEGDDPKERPRPITRTQQLTDILCNLPCQMFQKALVCTATKTSWSVITPSMAAKRPRIFEELATLEVGFPNRYVFENYWTLWENTVNSLLPTIAKSLGDKQKGQQGLSCLAARSAFLDLQKKIPDAYRKEVVRLVRKYVNNHWLWLPNGPAKNRIWSTGECKSNSARRVGLLNGGPWIVLKPQNDGFALP
ncbi:hypothetical protein RhiJN_13675 [Ceratobasidium sp. AG-Ba]|nr:hypothetical protein RhiJN_13675 [Ceratobasidium sp. AG-Ba]QRW14233.1 hypothetical protein RhiLY_13232 [Ceratobasidium sp. AG-Ba]